MINHNQAMEEIIKDLASQYFPEFFNTGVPDEALDAIPDIATLLSPIPGIPLGGLLEEPYNVNMVRRDFPILDETIKGNNLIWLDNAATTQKPKAVMDRMKYYYDHENSNIHRSAHDLAYRTTVAFEETRRKIADFLNARAEEIVFVRGATEGINLVAQSYGIRNLGADHEVLVSMLEHHANIVPWQTICQYTGSRLRVIPVDDSGQVDMPEFERLLSEKTKLVAITQVSNALGTITPVKEMISLAHNVGAKVLVDGAQAVAHMKVDVQDLDCDFYVFSGHKIYGPTGIGVLYGKYDILDSMPPYQTGGSMIEDVSFEKTVFKSPPHKFEAGTPNIAGAIGLGTAIEYFLRLNPYEVFKYEKELYQYSLEALSHIPGLNMIGKAKDGTSILSFKIKGYNDEDVGRILNEEGIALRTGHHCSQPILRRLGHESTIRASLALYNTRDEVDHLVYVLSKMQGVSNPLQHCML